MTLPALLINDKDSVRITHEIMIACEGQSIFADLNSVEMYRNRISLGGR
jgi:hypothetical protein